MPKVQRISDLRLWFDEFCLSLEAFTEALGINGEVVKLKDFKFIGLVLTGDFIFKFLFKAKYNYTDDDNYLLSILYNYLYLCTY